MHTLSQIRSLAIGKANTLQRAARHLDALRPAFAEWNSGDIYICKKTGDYRYRYGTESKAVAPWSKIAQQTFPSTAAFALASLVLGPAPVLTDASKPAKPAAPKAKPVGHGGRANIIQLATARA